MDIVIGIRDSHRELQLETDASAADIRSQLEAAYSGDLDVLWFTDTKGRQVGVPTKALAYIELAADAARGRVGFSS